MGLPAFTATFDLHAIERAFTSLEHAIDSELDHVFTETANKVAQQVKATHPWENRTGRLEASIEPLRPTGRALSGTLQGGVVMGAPYATYLEGYPPGPGGIGGGIWRSMTPAWEVIEPYFAHDCQAALDRAVSHAGLA